MQSFLRIHEKDNVAVALKDIPAGSVLRMPSGGEGAEDQAANAAKNIPTDPAGSPRDVAENSAGLHAVIAAQNIPAGHKMAIRSIPAGSQVIKYGFPIGIATEDIPQGCWVHTHNIRTGLGEMLDYTYEPAVAASWGASGTSVSGPSISGSPIPDSSILSPSISASPLQALPRTFQGFLRPDGRAGVRNEIWIIPTVGCVNDVASAIAREAKTYLKGSVEDVIAFSHPYGCSQMAEDQENTRQILADLIRHPNAGGVLVLGLGCENSNIEVLKPYLGDYDPNRVRFLVAQEQEDEIGEACQLVRELIDYAADFSRTAVPAEKLVVGLKCGGSDGFSGITANPLVGRFSDLLISQGGTTILTEVPEMFGAETLLMNRCANEALFRKTVDLINDFKNYFTSHGQTIYENPSPGNKKGGISTLEDKSLGCTQKSGSAPVMGVLAYGDRVATPGLNLLSAPGNDLVASTALAAAGAQIVLFTTGRGTPFASPVPTVKISSNSPLAAKKSNWIDYNAGVLAEGSSLAEEAPKLFNYVLEVASGRRVCSERAGYHDMAIFKQGVTL